MISLLNNNKQLFYLASLLLLSQPILQASADDVTLDWFVKTYSDESVVVGASVGVALYPDSGNTSEDLVKSADMAMYSAKENGRNRVELAESDVKPEPEV